MAHCLSKGRAGNQLPASIHPLLALASSLLRKSSWVLPTPRACATGWKKEESTEGVGLEGSKDPTFPASPWDPCSTCRPDTCWSAIAVPVYLKQGLHLPGGLRISGGRHRRREYPTYSLNPSKIPLGPASADLVHYVDISVPTPWDIGWHTVLFYLALSQPCEKKILELMGIQFQQAIAVIIN